MPHSARTGTTLAAACLAAALLLASAADGRVTRDRPPPAFTGGFAEPSCGQCHIDAPVNSGGGTLALDGLPAEFEPGRSYALTVTLAQRGLRAAGFQLSARFDDGTQAGALSPAHSDSARVAVTALNDIQYIHHTYDGTYPLAPDTARWRFDWHAPLSGSVVMHFAVNAADDDASPLGDLIYTRSARTATAK